MADIGLRSTSGLSAFNTKSTDNQVLLNGTGFTYTASSGDTVATLGFYCGASTGNGSGVELGLYDITSGAPSAPLVASGTIAAPTANSENVVSITPVSLTAGHTYCVALSVVSSTNVTLNRAFSSNAARSGTLTGSSALTTWSDLSGLSQKYYIFAVTAAASPPTLTSGPTASSITSAGFTISGTPDQAGTAYLIVTAVGASQPADATFDASAETASMTASTQFNIAHTGQ